MLNYLPPTNQFGRFRELLSENRDMVLVFINAQLTELFSNADTALLDFAERAESDLMQSRFFQALGAVHKKRGEVEHLFRQEISNGFDQLGRARVPDKPARTEEDDEPESQLSLVEPDEVEESVAVANLTSAAKSAYYSQLYALGQRLSVVNLGRKLEEPDIPAGPTRLVESFRKAMEPLCIDVKAKLILYAMFDKYVMRHLKDVYDEFNSNLKNAGILPNLKPLVARSKGRATGASAGPTDESGQPVSEQRTPAPRVTPEPASGALRTPTQPAVDPANLSLGTELFEGILTLLARRRGPSVGHGSQGGAVPAGAGQAAVALSPAEVARAHERILSVVDELRPVNLYHPGSIIDSLDNLPNIAVDPCFVDKIKAAIHQEQAQIFSRVSREQMPSLDADTIDLIGMLFEYMLNDPLLPNVAKALLSHLHTPYLKLSLVAKDLLIDSEHPARLLLDRLVEAGGQWVYENDIERGIYPHMQTVVDRVLREASATVPLLRELLDYFSAAVEECRRKAEAVEHRARESMRGRERLLAAKQRATNAMQELVARSPLPNAVGQFLVQTWSDRLVFILLRLPEGEQSEEWRRAAQIADDLVWLFEPKTTMSEREDVIRVCTLLQEEIQYGLDTLGGYHQRHVDEMFALLQDPSSLINWTKVPSRTPYQPPAEARQPEPAAPSTTDSRPISRGPGTPPPSVEAAAVSQQQAREREMLEKVQQLQFGTWFEFQDPGNPTRRRLKLSWLSPLTSTCMFVDRSGIQAEIKPLVDLARMLIAGSAKIIPKPRHPFVEGALRAIKKTLQRSVETP